MKTKIVTKLGELLTNRGITQAQLAEMTGLRPSTISEIVRDTRTVINKEHIAKIANALNIGDIREIIDLVYVPDDDDAADG